MPPWGTAVLTPSSTLNCHSYALFKWHPTVYTLASGFFHSVLHSWDPTVLCVKLELILITVLFIHFPIDDCWFPVWGYYDYHCYENSCTCLFMKIHKLFCWVHTKDENCWVMLLFNVSRLMSLCTSVPKKQGMWLAGMCSFRHPSVRIGAGIFFSPCEKRNFLPTSNFWAPALFQLSKDAVLIALVYFMISMRSAHCCNRFSKHDTSWLHSENWVNSQLCASGS